MLKKNKKINTVVDFKKVVYVVLSLQHDNYLFLNKIHIHFT